MSNYHTIAAALIPGTFAPGSLEAEHNAVVTEFAQSTRLQAAALEALQAKSGASREAANIESSLLATANGERSWSALGGHDAAATNDRLRRECRLLAILSGTATEGWGVSGDGYLTWGEVMRAVAA